MREWKYIEGFDICDYFNCYGTFYKICLGKEKFKCRGHLEIVEKQFNKSFENPMDILTNKPDALFILMNPGSSEVDTNEPDVEYSTVTIEDYFKRKADNISVAIPDPTQYAVMNVMVNMNWNHVRVLNLSDLKFVDGGNLNKHISTFNKLIKDNDLRSSDIHSLFTETREEERKIFFNIKDSAPIILGWGRGQHLKKLARMCFKQLPLDKTEVA